MIGHLLRQYEGVIDDDGFRIVVVTATATARFGRIVEAGYAVLDEVIHVVDVHAVLVLEAIHRRRTGVDHEGPAGSDAAAGVVFVFFFGIDDDDVVLLQLSNIVLCLLR